MASRDRLAEGSVSRGEKKNHLLSPSRKKEVSRYQRRFGNWRRVKVNRSFHFFLCIWSCCMLISSGFRVLSRGLNRFWVSNRVGDFIELGFSSGFAILFISSCFFVVFVKSPYYA